MWFCLLARRVIAEPRKEVLEVWKASGGKLGTLQTLKRYKNGRRAAKKYGNLDPIAVANEIWPGTNEIWTSPVWQVLKGERISQEAVIDGISSLGSTMKTIVLTGEISNFPSPN
jgi:hypothetical protein